MILWTALLKSDKNPYPSFGSLDKSISGPCLTRVEIYFRYTGAENQEEIHETDDVQNFVILLSLLLDARTQITGGILLSY